MNYEDKDKLHIAFGGLEHRLFNIEQCRYIQPGWTIKEYFPSIEVEVFKSPMNTVKLHLENAIILVDNLLNDFERISAGYKVVYEDERKRVSDTPDFAEDFYISSYNLDITDEEYSESVRTELEGYSAELNLLLRHPSLNRPVDIKIIAKEKLVLSMTTDELASLLLVLHKAGYLWIGYDKNKKAVAQSASNSLATDQSAPQTVGLRSVYNKMTKSEFDDTFIIKMLSKLEKARLAILIGK